MPRRVKKELKKVPEFLLKANSDASKENSRLARVFSDLADYEKDVNKKIHKYYAYRRAAHSVMNWPLKIASGAEAMATLPGVGKKMAQMIDEYLESGKVQQLENEKKNAEFAKIKELVRVDGIGPAQAQKYLKLGLSSLADLRANVDKLNHHQRIGLKYVEDFEARIPRQEMDEINELLTQQIKSVDEKFSVTLCGSYRRGAMSSYHIDVLLTHPWYHSAITRIKQEATIKEEPAIAVAEQPEREKKAESELDPHSLVDSINKKHAAILLDKVVAKLIGTQFLTDTFSFGGTKYTGVCCLSKEGSLHRRITMRLMPQDEFVCALFFMTGSFDFGKEMRRIAMRRGFMLNEYCLRRIHRSGRLGSPIKVTCEQDIFEALGQDYKPPEERNL